MQKYYVAYEDDYPENGGVGFEEFETEAEALQFISLRLRLRAPHAQKKRTLDDYDLIKGVKLPLKKVEVVVKVEVDKSPMPCAHLSNHFPPYRCDLATGHSGRHSAATDGVRTAWENMSHEDSN